jgi:hypothetical protein
VVRLREASREDLDLKRLVAETHSKPITSLGMTGPMRARSEVLVMMPAIPVPEP